MTALEAEGIPCEPGYPPVHSPDVFQNGAYRQRLGGEQRARDHSFLKQAFPNAQRAFSRAIWIPQPALLGDEEDMQEIAGGGAKAPGRCQGTLRTYRIKSWSLSR